MAPFEMDQYSFEIVQAAVDHANPLADLKVWPGLVWQSGIERLPDRFEFTLFHWYRSASNPQNLLHAGRHEERPAVLKVKPAEQVSWE